MSLSTTSFSHKQSLHRVMQELCVMPEFAHAKPTSILRIAQDLLAQGLRLSEKLGNGTAGFVFALVNSSNKPVKVLKVFKGPSGCEESSELNQANTITHSSVVIPERSYLEQELGSRISFIRAQMMPYVDGVTLCKCSMSDWTFSEILGFWESSLEGLKCLAKRNLSHYDLHDENLMVTAEKTAKIIDLDLVGPKSQTDTDEKRLLEHIKARIPFSRLPFTEYLHFCFEILGQERHEWECSEIDQSKPRIDLMLDCVRNWRELDAIGFFGV